MPVRTKFGYHIIKVFDKRPAQGEVEVSHIMIRTGEDRDNEKAKNTIFTIYDELQAGVSWGDLCRNFPRTLLQRTTAADCDPSASEPWRQYPNLRLPHLGFKSLEIYLIRCKRAMDGMLSDSKGKYHFPPFRILSPRLKNRVQRDERTTLSKQALQHKLRNEYQFEENPEAKSAVLAMADSSLSKGRWKAAAIDSDGSIVLP